MRRFLLGILTVCFIASSIFSLSAAQETNECFADFETVSQNLEAFEPDPELLLAIRQYKAYREKLNKVKETFRNIYSVQGQLEEDKTSREYRNEENTLPEILAQLVVIRTFLKQQDYKGAQNIGLWARNCEMLGFQAVIARTQLRSIVSDYEGRINPLLKIAIERIINNLTEVLDKVTDAKLIESHWKTLSESFCNYLWRIANDIQTIIDELPYDTSNSNRIAKGKLKAIQGLLNNQQNIGKGNPEYWLQSYYFLRRQALIISGALENILSQEPPVSNLLKPFIQDEIKSLEYIADKHGPVSKSKSYWRDACDTIASDMRTVGKRIREVANSL